MKSTILLFLVWIFVSGQNAHSQIIPNYMDVNIWWGQNNPMGITDHSVEFENLYSYTEPYLFSNMTKSQSYGWEIMGKPNHWLAIGLQRERGNYTDWQYSGSLQRFKGSTIRTSLWGIILEPYIPWKPVGIFNRLRLGLQIIPCRMEISPEILPVLYQIPVSSLTGYDPEAVSNTEIFLLNNTSIRSATNTFWGLSINGNIEYSVLPHIGVFLRYGYRKIGTNSYYYPDKVLESTYFRVGLSLGFYKHKKYYY